VAADDATIVNATIVKVGGSLLTHPDLSELTRAWRSQHRRRHVFIVGGGSLADAIRQLDAEQKLGEEFAHWRCVDVLDTTAAIFARLSGLPVVSAWSDLTAPATTDDVVFAPASFLRCEEPNLPQPLPHSWSVTSDSIAARIADLLDAPLVLWKSADPPAGDAATLVRMNYVDAFFARASAHVSDVAFVNLRTWNRAATIGGQRTSDS
jgi:aspartokinase-like uncharacterized kinase